MTEQEFRSDAELLSEARKLLANSTLKIMLSVLESSAPQRQMMKPTAEGNPTAALIEFGKVLGHTDTMDRLKRLGEAWPMPDDQIPATYTDTTNQDENG